MRTVEEAKEYLQECLEGVEEDIRRAQLMKDGANTHTVNQLSFDLREWKYTVTHGSSYYTYLCSQPAARLFTLAYKLRSARATLRLIAAGVPHKEAQRRGRVETEEILGKKS